MIPDKSLDEWFTHHAPKGDQAGRYGEIRNAGRAFADLVNALCPDGPDKTTAVRTIREAVMWANAAIACGE